MKMNALGINARNLLGIAPRNGRPAIRLARDKVATKALLTEAGVPVPRTRAVLRSMWDLDGMARHLSTPAAIKPAAGAAGGGILLLEPMVGGGWRTPGGRTLDVQEVEAHAAHILHGGFGMGSDDRVLIEDLLVPHAEVAGWHGGGIADVRLIFVDGEFALAMLRMPTVYSDGKANLHQGGVASAIDTEGRLGPVFDGRTHAPAHPDGAVVEGEILPFWKEVLEVGRSADAALPLGWSGVDVVVTVDGPVVLEVNARPGLAIQNVTRQSLTPWL